MTNTVWERQNLGKFALGFGALAIMLSACATTPKPNTDNMEETVIVAEIPKAEVVTPPPPSAPIEEKEFIIDTPPANEALANLPTPGSEGDFVFQSGGDSRIYFAYDQYDLSTSAMDVLRRQSQWLNIYPDVNVVIEGNADERGTREYNLALGARRSNSVRDFLVSQGINPHRLTTISYGKERPIDGRSNEAGWSRNRNSNSNISISTLAY